MNAKLLLPIALTLALAACSKTEGPPGAPGAQPPPAAQAIPDPSLPEVAVSITANDQMKFDVVSIEARPGQKVTVTLKNVGTMPKMSMGHNFVLLSNDIELPSTLR